MKHDHDDIAGWPSAAVAARVLGVTPLRVRQLMDRGRLHFIGTKLGRLIDPQDLERLRSEREARERASS